MRRCLQEALLTSTVAAVEDIADPLRCEKVMSLVQTMARLTMRA